MAQAGKHWHFNAQHTAAAAAGLAKYALVVEVPSRGSKPTFTVSPDTSLSKVLMWQVRWRGGGAWICAWIPRPLAHVRPAPLPRCLSSHRGTAMFVLPW